MWYLFIVLTIILTILKSSAIISYQNRSLLLTLNKDILSSKIISFADDTRVYTNITQIENSDSLQADLDYIYLWAINNNMLFNHQKFNYISFSSSMSSVNTNVYYSPSLDIINPSENVIDLGITMSRNCSFDVHINILCKNVLICPSGF